MAKPGRPKVVDTMFRDGKLVESMIRQDNFRTYRSISDMAYCYSASCLLMEAASEISNLEEICGKEYMCRSILNQLGRMQRQDRFDKASIIKVARAAIEAKRRAISVKDIEAYIRHGRLTDEW